MKGKRQMADPQLPVEMTEESIKQIYPDLGVGTSVWPLHELYPLLTRLEKALIDNEGNPYNPDKLSIHDFKWAHVRTHGPGTTGTTQLMAESNATGKVHSGDTALIPNPEGKFQGYMVELTKLAKF